MNDRDENDSDVYNFISYWVLILSDNSRQLYDYSVGHLSVKNILHWQYIATSSQFGFNIFERWTLADRKHLHFAISDTSTLSSPKLLFSEFVVDVNIISETGHYTYSRMR